MRTRSLRKGWRVRARSGLALSTVLIGAAALPVRAQSLAEVFKKVNPSVVVVLAKEKDIGTASDATPASIVELGSGVLVSTEGKVLTAAHVVQTADAIVVEFLTGETLRARVLSSEPAADVALLQLERAPVDSPAARLGDSDAVEVGDQVFVVGAPMGISHTLTVGHISARRRPSDSASALSLAEFFQTDAAINEGDSGGPLFNMDGEVVGVVSHILSRSGGSEGLGFAITSNVARQLMLQERSLWSGLSGTMVSGDLAQVFNLPPPGVGLLVQRIASGSPAERIGLRAGTLRATVGDEELIVGGDIILAIQGISLGEPSGYVLVRDRLKELHPGASITVTVLRAGRKIDLTGSLDP